MSDRPMTLREVDGLRNAPSRVVRRLAATAALYIERVAELNRQLREAQEKLAASQIEMGDPLLIVLCRDGIVEVWAREWRPIAFAHMPDLGRGREGEAEEYMLSKVSAKYRDLYWTGKVIAMDSATACMSRTAYELHRRVVGEYEAVKQLEVSRCEA